MHHLPWVDGRPGDAAPGSGLIGIRRRLAYCDIAGERRRTALPCCKTERRCPWTGQCLHGTYACGDSEISRSVSWPCGRGGCVCIVRTYIVYPGTTPPDVGLCFSSSQSPGALCVGPSIPLMEMGAKFGLSPWNEAVLFVLSERDQRDRDLGTAQYEFEGRLLSVSFVIWLYPKLRARSVMARWRCV